MCSSSSHNPRGHYKSRSLIKECLLQWMCQCVHTYVCVCIQCIKEQQPRKWKVEHKTRLFTFTWPRSSNDGSDSRCASHNGTVDVCFMRYVKFCTFARNIICVPSGFCFVHKFRSLLWQSTNCTEKSKWISKLYNSLYIRNGGWVQLKCVYATPCCVHFMRARQNIQENLLSFVQYEKGNENKREDHKERMRKLEKEKNIPRAKDALIMLENVNGWLKIGAHKSRLFSMFVYTFFLGVIFQTRLLNLGASTHITFFCRRLKISSCFLAM